jgi:hypothetical protein
MHGTGCIGVSRSVTSTSTKGVENLPPLSNQLKTKKSVELRSLGPVVEIAFSDSKNNHRNQATLRACCAYMCDAVAVAMLRFACALTVCPAGWADT